jgi:hypothetical protein
MRASLVISLATFTVLSACGPVGFEPPRPTAPIAGDPSRVVLYYVEGQGVEPWFRLANGLNRIDELARIDLEEIGLDALTIKRVPTTTGELQPHCQAFGCGTGYALEVTLLREHEQLALERCFVHDLIDSWRWPANGRRDCTPIWPPQTDPSRSVDLHRGLATASAFSFHLGLAVI